MRGRLENVKKIATLAPFRLFMKGVKMTGQKMMAVFCLSTFFISSAYSQSQCITENPPPPPAIGVPMYEVVGKTYCAPPGGVIFKNSNGQAVCAPGQWAKTQTAGYFALQYLVVL